MVADGGWNYLEMSAQLNLKKRSPIPVYSSQNTELPVF